MPRTSSIGELLGVVVHTLCHFLSGCIVSMDHGPVHRLDTSPPSLLSSGHVRCPKCELEFPENKLPLAYSVLVARQQLQAQSAVSGMEPLQRAASAKGSVNVVIKLHYQRRSST